ncbi:metallophosphoesterase [Aeribacillus alveayuensis]|uniref:MPP superfamily phosphohydrolase n=1 Tax=Aeribacillus alveayuensis TaxID=279215 RepID=A0ABT9VLY5_9BACI|nr:putative MPP superfamily phosphohydrolase [Bacillus alveayuensis]
MNIFWKKSLFLIYVFFLLLTGSHHLHMDRSILATARPIKDSSQLETIVWLSDTQYYSERYPHIFQSQITWILQNRSLWNIRYVIHTGDIVNKGEDNIQWTRASEIMRQLDDAEMPYGVLAGNHDLVKKKSYQQYSLYFGENRFIGKPYYGKSYQNNRGHYDILTIGDQPFLFLYMGWGIGSEEIKWMNEVLKKYENHIAVLAFHKYLHKNGKRTFVGRKIFQNVVKENPNVKLVLSGHYDDSEYLVTKLDDNQDGTPDRKVYEILADYQGAPKGGQGFFRLFHFYTDSRTMYVRTFSPYVNQFYFYSPNKHPGKDEYWIDLSE